MSTNSPNKYTIDFKRTIVNLYRGGKTFAQLTSEYGIGKGTLSSWIKLFSEVKIDDCNILTAMQIKELQKRNDLLEEEN